MTERQECLIEIKIVSSHDGHRVVTTADGKEIHSTIAYADPNFAAMHAVEIAKRARSLLGTA